MATTYQYLPNTCDVQICKQATPYLSRVRDEQDDQVTLGNDVEHLTKGAVLLGKAACLGLQTLGNVSWLS